MRLFAEADLDAYLLGEKADFDPEKHPRGKTTERSRGGSFMPAGGAPLLHGVSDEAAGKAILATGELRPNPNPGKAFQSPIKGRVYLTTLPGYAGIYAIGGNVLGSESEGLPARMREGSGYIFEVSPAAIRDPQPDEDIVGEMLAQALDYNHYSKVPPGPPWLVELAQRTLSPKALREVKGGLAAWWSHAGKRLLREMSTSQKLELLKLGGGQAHVATIGPVPIIRAWRLDKSRVKELKPDGSNLFDIAEPVPIPSRKAESTHGGFFVALYLDPVAATKLAIPGYEPANELHITLAYVPEWDSAQAADALANVAEVALHAMPLAGTMRDVGRFTGSEASDGQDVLHAIPVVPGLEQLQQDVEAALARAGMKPWSRFGRFVPHTTLAYVAPDAPGPPASHVNDTPIFLDGMTVRAGDAAPVELPLGLMPTTARKFNPYHEPGGSEIGGHFAHAPEGGGGKETEAGVTSFTGAEPRSQVARDRQHFVHDLRAAGVDVVESRIGVGGWQDLQSGAVGAEHTWILRYRGNGRAERAIAAAAQAYHQQAAITATRVPDGTPDGVPRFRWTFGRALKPAETEAIVGLAKQAGFSGWTVDQAAGTVTVLTVPKFQKPADTARAALRFQQLLTAAGHRASWRAQTVRVTVMEAPDYERILNAKVAADRGSDGRGAGAAGRDPGRRRSAGGGDGSDHDPTDAEIDAVLLGLKVDPVTSPDAAPGAALPTQGRLARRRFLRRAADFLDELLFPRVERVQKIIRHEGDKWVLYTRDGSRVLGRHPTREAALAQERAIEAHKHAADFAQKAGVALLPRPQLGQAGKPGGLRVGAHAGVNIPASHQMNPQRMTGKPGETRWVEEDHPRGKTSEASTPGSFAPKGSEGSDLGSATSESHGGRQRGFGFAHAEKPQSPLSERLSQSPIESIKDHGGGISTTYFARLADGTKVVIKPESGAPPSDKPPRANITPGDDIERQLASNIVNNALGGLVDMPTYGDRDFGDTEGPNDEPIGRALIYNMREGRTVGQEYGRDWTQADAEQVSRMALFDAVIGNEDRHPNQAFVDPEDAHLIANDHDLAFPENNDHVWGNYNTLGARQDPTLTEHERHLLESFRGNKAVDQQLRALLPSDAVDAMWERVDTYLKTGRLPTTENGDPMAHHLAGDWITPATESSASSSSSGSGAVSFEPSGSPSPLNTPYSKIPDSLQHEYSAWLQKKFTTGEDKAYGEFVLAHPGAGMQEFWLARNVARKPSAEITPASAAAMGEWHAASAMAKAKAYDAWVAEPYKSGQYEEFDQWRKRMRAAGKTFLKDSLHAYFEGLPTVEKAKYLRQRRAA